MRERKSTRDERQRGMRKQINAGWAVAAFF
jgi:hypothetical protein